jgi:putative MFS transporter
MHLVTWSFFKKIRGSPRAGLTIYWFMGSRRAYMMEQLISSNPGPDRWKSVLASAAFFSATLLLIRMGTPESPRWLIGKGPYQRHLTSYWAASGLSFSGACYQKLLASV